MHVSIHGDVISLSSFKNQGSFAFVLVVFVKREVVGFAFADCVARCSSVCSVSRDTSPCCGLARLVYDTKLLQENSLSHCG